MNISELSPLPNNKISFRLCEYSKIPKECGCYVLSSLEGEIFYIGLSNNIHRRFQEHLESSEKTSKTAFGKAIWFSYLLCDKLNLEKLERTWLNEYQAKHGKLPIWNKVQSPIG